ncbi:hypothetical protein, partial [Corallococcus llansteffanensis]|uniref:hypothetical protein n=1 Tax=Corallococcus llansteffanensis TaxID=2316731 RepID=UPI001AC003EB
QLFQEGSILLGELDEPRRSSPHGGELFILRDYVDLLRGHSTSGSLHGSVREWPDAKRDSANSLLRSSSKGGQGSSVLNVGDRTPTLAPRTALLAPAVSFSASLHQHAAEQEAPIPPILPKNQPHFSQASKAMSTQKTPSNWERVGALIALGLAASEVATRLIGYALRAAVPEELTASFLAPLLVSAALAVAARKKNWNPASSSPPGKAISKKWVLVLFGGSGIALLAAVLGFLTSLQARIHAITYFETIETKTNPCTPEGPNARAVKTRLSINTALPSKTFIICPTSATEQVRTTLEASSGVDELEPWRQNRDCQRFALVQQTRELEFTSCLTPLASTAEQGGLSISVDTAEGIPQEIYPKEQLAWHDRLGVWLF